MLRPILRLDVKRIPRLDSIRKVSTTTYLHPSLPHRSSRSTNQNLSEHSRPYSHNTIKADKEFTLQMSSTPTPHDLSSITTSLVTTNIEDEDSDDEPYTPFDQISREDVVDPKSNHLESNVLFDLDLLNIVLEPVLTRLKPITSPSSAQDIEAYKIEFQRTLKAVLDEPGFEPEKFLSTPPLKKLEIHLLPDMPKRICPCCFGGDSLGIVLESETGLTRRMFVDGMAKAIWGEDGKSVEASGLAESKVAGSIIWPVGFDYMLQGGAMKFLYKREIYIWYGGSTTAT